MSKQSIYLLITVICSFLFFVLMFTSHKISAIIDCVVLIYSLISFSNLYGEELKNERNNKTMAIDNLIKNQHLTKNHFYSNEDLTQAIVIDEEKAVIGIIEFLNKQMKLIPIPFSSIIESELKEDDETVTKSSRGSQIGGAIIGSVIAGGVGAAVGGLSGKKVSVTKSKRIDLEITVNDLNNPIHRINFMNYPNSINKDSILYKEKYDKAIHWHKLMDIIIKRQENNQIVNH